VAGHEDESREDAVKTIVVRYETKPDRAEENKRLVEKVFVELDELSPDGFGYASFQLEDGVTFIHVVRETGAGEVSLSDLPAFQEFVAGVSDRCEVQPRASEAAVVGSYRFFDQ
jgi:hypothetical protein